MKHRMQIARPSPKVAKRLGINSNHHARIWCSCMDDAVSDPGTYAGQHATVVNDRTAQQAADDPRRLGSYDYLGIIDLRVPFSALALWRRHVSETNASEAAAFWGSAENLAYSPEQRLACALKALEFYGNYYAEKEKS